MFLIPCDNWKTLLFMKVYRYAEIYLTAMMLVSFKPFFKNNSVILIPRFQNKADYAF